MDQMNMNENYSSSGKKDDGGFGWSLLGCCIPVVGLILWLVWRDEKPNTAGAVIKGAIVGAILLVVCYVLSYVLGIGMLGVALTGLDY